MPTSTSSASARTSSPRWLFMVVLAAGIAARLPWLGAEGYAGDATMGAGQIAVVASQGYGRAYEYAYTYRPGDAHDLSYGPFYAAVTGGVSALWLRLAPQVGVAPLPLALPVFKLPVVAADLLIGWLVYVAARRRLSQGSVALAALHLLNPGMILVSAWWGQNDPLSTACVVAAVVALTARRPAAASSLAATLAVLTKAQSYFIAPLVAIVLIRSRRWLDLCRGALMAAAAAFVLCIPLIAEGHLMSLPLMYLKLVDRHATLHVNAFNVWWLGREWIGNRVPDTLTAFGPLTYKHVGLLMVGVYSVGLLVRVWVRFDIRDTALIAACLATAFFMLPTQIHTRYLHPVLPLLLLAAIYRPRLIVCFGVFTITFFMNQLHLILRSTGPPPLWLDQSERMGLSTTAMVVANLMTFAVLTWIALDPSSVARVPRVSSRESAA